jgi:hypothetical protein
VIGAIRGCLDSRLRGNDKVESNGMRTLWAHSRETGAQREARFLGRRRLPRNDMVSRHGNDTPLRGTYVPRSPAAQTKRSGQVDPSSCPDLYPEAKRKACVSPSRHSNTYGIGHDHACAIEEFSRSCTVGKNYRLAKKIGQALTWRACPHSTGSRLEPYSPVGARQGTGTDCPTKRAFGLVLH